MTNGKISMVNAALMVVLITFWGSSFVVVKFGLQEGLSPMALATFRFLIAGSIMLVGLAVNKARDSGYRVSVDKGDFASLLVLALTGITFMFAAQYTGIQLAGASIAAILVCLLSPIFIAVFSARFFGESLAKKQVLGIGIAAVGAFTVIAGGTLSVSHGQNFLVGSLILLFTPVSWASYNLLGKKVLIKYDPFVVVTYVTVIGGLCLIPFGLAEQSLGEILVLSWNGWFAILFLALTCSVLGYYLWFYVLKQAGATVTSSFLFAEPIVTVLFAFLFIGEQISLFVIGGGFLIFVGVYLIARR